MFSYFFFSFLCLNERFVSSLPWVIVHDFPQLVLRAASATAPGPRGPEYQSFGDKAREEYESLLRFNHGYNHHQRHRDA